jgi:hypothetical protein
MSFVDSLYDRLEFCTEAVKNEFRQSKVYKLLSLTLTPLYIILGSIVVVQNPVPTWPWATRIVALLGLLVVVLSFTIEAIYQSVRRNEKARPEIKVSVPTAFVRPVPNNQTVCQVFLRVELRNPTPYRPNLVNYLLDFKVKEKDAVRLTKMLDLQDFQACNTIESVDEDDGETWLTFTDYEDLDDLRNVISVQGPPEDGFPSIGWLGFIVRKSVLPYGSYERGTGRGYAIVDDDGEVHEEEETETVYYPKFDAIEELKLIVVDGHQNSWEGIADRINPRGETVISRPKSA